jgi:hypothetical protein
MSVTSFPVRVVVCCSWITSNEEEAEMSSGSRRAVVTGGDGEEVSDMGSASASASASASVVTPVSSRDLTSVWEFEKIVKRGGPDEESRSWYCGWCDYVSRGWSATKVMNHCAKVTGKNVKACTGSIPKTTLTAFQAYRFRKIGSSELKRQHQDAFAETVSQNQHDVGVMLEDSVSRASKSRGLSAVEGGDLAVVSVANATKLNSRWPASCTCEAETFVQSLD